MRSGDPDNNGELEPLISRGYFSEKGGKSDSQYIFFEIAHRCYIPLIDHGMGGSDTGGASLIFLSLIFFMTRSKQSALSPIKSAYFQPDRTTLDLLRKRLIGGILSS